MHLLLGISAFNSKFTKSYIWEILDWGFTQYDHVDVAHPGEDAYLLLAASGTPAGRALRKARKEFARHYRDIQDYCAESGHVLSSGRLVTFEDMKETRKYKELIDDVHREFNSNEQFRETCLDQTSKAIASRAAATGRDTDQFSPEIGVQYVLNELPIVLDPVSLLASLGGHTSDHCHIGYYQSWPVLDLIMENKTSLKCAASMTFTTVDTVGV